MNRVFLTGNLTRDVEVRYSQSGAAVARTGIAVKRPFSKDKDSVDFFNLVTFNKTAEVFQKWLKKGSRVLIEGRLQTNSYEKNGVKHNSVDVLVENVEFAGSNNSNSGNTSNGNNGNKKATGDSDFKGEEIDEYDTPF